MDLAEVAIKMPAETFVLGGNGFVIQTKFLLAKEHEVALALKTYFSLLNRDLGRIKACSACCENKKAEQITCKPGSVSLMPEPAGMMAIHLGCLLPDTSCNLPGHL